jgi:hypothetical protein
MPNWEALTPAEQDQILLATGTTFIMEQLPPRLVWLADPIAHATMLRSARLKSITELMQKLALPIPDPIRDDLSEHNCLVAALGQLQMPVAWMADLNAWDVRLDKQSGHWAVGARAAAAALTDNAAFLFLHQSHLDADKHRYFHVVDDLEADDVQGSKLTLTQLAGNHFAWLGGAEASSWKHSAR